MDELHSSDNKKNSVAMKSETEKAMDYLALGIADLKANRDKLIIKLSKILKDHINLDTQSTKETNFKSPLARDIETQGDELALINEQFNKLIDILQV